MKKSNSVVISRSRMPPPQLFRAPEYWAWSLFALKLLCVVWFLLWLITPVPYYHFLLKPRLLSAHCRAYWLILSLFLSLHLSLPPPSNQAHLAHLHHCGISSTWPVGPLWLEGLSKFYGKLTQHLLDCDCGPEDCHCSFVCNFATICNLLITLHFIY